MHGINNNVHGARIANPNGNSSPSWCNWTVIDCNKKRLCELFTTPTCKTVSRGEKMATHSITRQKCFPYCHWNIETARRWCSVSVRACMHVCDGLNEKRCESEWCPPFWILISFSDMSTLTPPTPPHTSTPPLCLLFSTSTNPASSHLFLPRSFPSHRSILETGYEGLCYLITDQSEREWVRKKDEEKVCSGGQEWEELKKRSAGEDGDFFHFVFIHLLFQTEDYCKLHGPNWTNDWVQIRPTLMNRWMRK